MLKIIENEDIDAARLEFKDIFEKTKKPLLSLDELEDIVHEQRANISKFENSFSELSIAGWSRKVSVKDNKAIVEMSLPFSEIKELLSDLGFEKKEDLLLCYVCRAHLMYAEHEIASHKISKTLSLVLCLLAVFNALLVMANFITPFLYITWIVFLFILLSFLKRKVLSKHRKLFELELTKLMVLLTATHKLFLTQFMRNVNSLSRKVSQ